MIQSPEYWMKGLHEQGKGLVRAGIHLAEGLTAGFGCWKESYGTSREWFLRLAQDR